jgi:hypothetical protein
MGGGAISSIRQSLDSLGEYPIFGRKFLVNAGTVSRSRNIQKTV